VLSRRRKARSVLGTRRCGQVMRHSATLHCSERNGTERRLIAPYLCLLGHVANRCHRLSSIRGATDDTASLSLGDSGALASLHERCKTSRFDAWLASLKVLSAGKNVFPCGMRKNEKTKSRNGLREKFEPHPWKTHVNWDESL